MLNRTVVLEAGLTAARQGRALLTLCALMVTLYAAIAHGDPAPDERSPQANPIESPGSLSWTTANARLRIQTQINGGPWRAQQRAVSPQKGDDVRLRVAPVEGAEIRWFMVFPDLTPLYANANPPWEPDPYQWVGFDDIHYHRVELRALRNQWTVAPLEIKDLWAPVRAWLHAQSKPSAHYHDQVGTFRFQAVVKHHDTILRSHGVEDVGDKGISTRVTRVSVRDGDGFLGVLRSFFNVPGVFGSVTHQSHHYIGVDCADVLVAAHGRWRKRPMRKNYNVDMLVSTLKQNHDANLRDGRPDPPISWGEHLKPGDLIAVQYPGARRYQHIGALAGDTDGDGLLSPGDQVIHAGPHPLVTAPLSQGAFDGHIKILRWK